jgi:subtilase family serine protease
LDIETVIALAPRPSLLVYPVPDVLTAKAAIDEYTRIVDDDRAQILSTSYGLCEAVTRAITPGLIACENTVFEQAATEGISVFAASGDSGSEACEQFSKRLKELATQEPASQPFVTGVGGTELTAIGPPPAQRVWNEARITEGAGGGGISSVWAMPPWQKGPGAASRLSSGRPCHAARGYYREVPDLSASAAAHGDGQRHPSGQQRLHPDAPRPVSGDALVRPGQRGRFADRPESRRGAVEVQPPLAA